MTSIVVGWFDPRVLEACSQVTAARVTHVCVHAHIYNETMNGKCTAAYTHKHKLFKQNILHNCCFSAYFGCPLHPKRKHNLQMFYAHTYRERGSLELQLGSKETDDLTVKGRGFP